MGFSGMKGKVYLADDHCPADLSGTNTQSSTSVWPDEVKRFMLTEKANIRRYVHDKSFGFQDVVSGIRSVDVSLDAVFHGQCGGAADSGSSGVNSVYIYHAGQVVWLELEPFGPAETDGGNGRAACNCNPIRGYFMIEQIATTTNIESGDPVEYTMTLTSKGYIDGLGDDQSFTSAAMVDPKPNWGGFECACEGGSTSN